MVWRRLLSLNFISQPLLVSNFSSSVSLPLNYLQNWRELGFLLWIKLWVGLLCWLGGKEFACDAGDSGMIPGSGTFPGEGNGSPSSFLAWRIPWTDEPEGLCPMGSQRFVHDWVTNTFIKGMLWLIWAYIQTTKTLFISAIWLFCFLIIHVFNEVTLLIFLQNLFCGAHYPTNWLV